MKDDKQGKWLLSKTLDNNIRKIIMDCPYYNYGACDLEFNYRRICPSNECLCARKMGLKANET